MKRTKRLTCLLAALTMLMWTYIPAQAEYFGTLPNDQDWTMQVTNSANAPCAVRVYYVGRALDVIDVLTVPSTITILNTLPSPGKRVKSIVIEVDPAPAGRATISVNGGVGINIDGPGRIVFDVV